MHYKTRPKNIPTIFLFKVCFYLSIALYFSFCSLDAQLSASSAKKNPYHTKPVPYDVNDDEKQLYQKKLHDYLYKNFKNKALKQGISQETIHKIFPTIEFLPIVIKRDRNQANHKLSLDQYRTMLISKKRLNLAVQKYQQHKNKLYTISEKYGVDPYVILALWGIESNYGQYTGKYSVFSSLATLAFEGRRRTFFEKELIHALKIAQDQKRTVMKGSWAGAMGQIQFMPSSYQNFADDGNNNGQKDIWADLDDILSSIANYLDKNGWKENNPILTNIKREKAANQSIIALSQKYAKKQHNINKNIKYKIVKLDPVAQNTFIVYANYDVLKTWNRSDLFAITVADFARMIKEHATEHARK